MLFDKLGYPIKLGDTVVYVPTGRIDSWASVSTGVVKTISGDKLKAGNMVKFRNSKNVINLSYFRPLDEVKQESPELFI